MIDKAAREHWRAIDRRDSRSRLRTRNAIDPKRIHEARKLR